MKSRVAIIAALPREIRRLTRNWKQGEKVSRPGLSLYTSDNAIVVCGGIGGAQAELAALTALNCGPVHRLVSVGWAGGLRPAMKSGTVDRPRRVVDAASGESYETGEAGAVLVTAPAVANIQEKSRLAQEFSADLVDMEAAAVARVAQSRGIAFLAIKAVSDEHDFELPGMERFVDGEGRFREAAFAAHVALRPWLWKNVIRMACGSAEAAHNLCRELEEHLKWDKRAWDNISIDDRNKT